MLARALAEARLPSPRKVDAGRGLADNRVGLGAERPGIGGPALDMPAPLSDSPPFEVGVGPIAGRQSLAGEKRPHIGLDLVEVFLAGHRVTLDRQPKLDTAGVPP
jgi:hypothetical protein